MYFLFSFNWILSPHIETVDYIRVDEECNNDEVVEQVLVVKDNCYKKEIEKAKITELNNWSEKDVYEEIAYEHQYCISTRWVISEKQKDGECVIKARLVA